MGIYTQGGGEILYKTRLRKSDVKAGMGGGLQNTRPIKNTGGLRADTRLGDLIARGNSGAGAESRGAVPMPGVQRTVWLHRGKLKGVPARSRDLLIKQATFLRHIMARGAEEGQKKSGKGRNRCKNGNFIRPEGMEAVTSCSDKKALEADSNSNSRTFGVRGKDTSKRRAGPQVLGRDRGEGEPEPSILHFAKAQGGSFIRNLRSYRGYFISYPVATTGVACVIPCSVKSGAGGFVIRALKHSMAQVEEQFAGLSDNRHNRKDGGKRKVNGRLMVCRRCRRGCTKLNRGSIKTALSEALKNKGTISRALPVASMDHCSEGASDNNRTSYFQIRMGRNKEKEKAKRLYEVTPNKVVASKIARTDGELRDSPDQDMDPGIPLMTDMMDSQDIPTTPSQTEKSFGSGMVPDSQPDQLNLEEQMEAMQAPVMDPEASRDENGSVLAPFPWRPSQVGSKEEAPKGAEGMEEALDWKIPASFRLDWLTARVDQRLIQLDVVGGLYDPVFIVEEAVKMETKCKPERMEASPPKKEGLNFFKIRIRSKKPLLPSGAPVGKEEMIYAREDVREDMIKHIESLNQNRGMAIITNCLDMLKQIRKVQERQNSFANRTMGKTKVEKLWDYGLRKLVHLAGEAWGMQTVLPVFPLIKSSYVGIAEFLVHEGLLNNFENNLIKAFTACEDEQSRDLAIEYWSSIVSSQLAVTGNSICGGDVILILSRYSDGVRVGESSGSAVRDRGIRRGLNRAAPFKISPGEIRQGKPKGKKWVVQVNRIKMLSSTDTITRQGIPKESSGGDEVVLTLYLFMFRIEVTWAEKPPEHSWNRLLFSEKMADLLFKELVGTSKLNKEDKVRQAEACMKNLEALQVCLGDLIMRVTKGQGSPEFKGLAMEGSKQLSKDVDAQIAVLRGSIKYLEGKQSLTITNE